MLDRRQVLSMATRGAMLAGIPAGALHAEASPEVMSGIVSVRQFGATGDGHTLDSPAINRAIEAAAARGGGTVFFPAGTYACYSLHLWSHICLYLDQGATILAASVPMEGTTTGGYDAAEPQDPAYEAFQDYGHNHWHNSLLWGEDIHDVSILGPGLIWGKGLSRGHDFDKELPDTKKPGVGNKAIALKNCRNVVLRDFSILKGGWFGILATGVDNLTIDNLKIDTDRDGMDIDCCRNVRVSNCTVNSPIDDGICPKSSYALGYARVTENVTITNCFVTGSYVIGSVLDGSWKRMPEEFNKYATGRIKCGTESNGGFRNITIANCVFEHSRGFALETVDGAVCEDITFTGVAMRGSMNAPLFLRLGRRMRGPADAKVGTLRRVLISNVTSSDGMQLPSILAGVPGYPLEDIKISDVYLHQVGGGDAAMAKLSPAEQEQAYPEPTMFGDLPATGLYVRHVRNLELSNVEISTAKPDARPAFALVDVEGADCFRVRAPRPTSAPAFSLRRVQDFRVFGSQFVADAKMAAVDETSL
ncbi:glycoside hydrolase family 28 protein [Acidipila sp. EB88]|uniref:rhamnogalacturonidase n=1 Tax=Acidipila sp. EB88 TaxID=2305226 RepID=UPI000F5E9A8A|nr:glycoside hydrolase family 28 protein [Acidipila sp. EB88]RRA49425.1 glycoside hydrolase family 28 protein [Acidipila sp. EB88]